MEFCAQPISATPFHTIAVKWPVAQLPDSQPGKVEQQSTSEYQAVAAASKLPYPIAKFSPAGPAGGASW